MIRWRFFSLTLLAALQRLRLRRLSRRHHPNTLVPEFEVLQLDADLAAGVHLASTSKAASSSMAFPLFCNSVL